MDYVFIHFLFYFSTVSSGKSKCFCLLQNMDESPKSPGSVVFGLYPSQYHHCLLRTDWGPDPADCKKLANYNLKSFSVQVPEKSPEEENLLATTLGLGYCMYESRKVQSLPYKSSRVFGTQTGIKSETQSIFLWSLECGVEVDSKKVLSL